MGWESGTQSREKSAYRVSVGKPEKLYCLENLRVDRIIIIKWILKKQNRRVESFHLVKNRD